MANPRAASNVQDLKKLETRVDELIATVDRLRRENELLKNSNSSLSDKHLKLSEKTRIARERIEGMIGRLKSLERTAQ
jgi:cell division protein ZapB